MAATTPLKALIYTRVSNDLANGRSVKEQEADCRQECGRNGWAVVEHLSDNSVGASRHSKGHRHGWDQVKKRIAVGDIDVLVIWEASRATRDLRVFAELVTLLASTGTKISYSGRLLDLDDDDDIFTAGLDALISGKAAGDTSKRVRRSMRDNAKHGRPHGPILYGYERKFDEKTGRPGSQFPHPERAPIVARIFSDYNAGNSRADVANALNAEGITTAKGRQWEPRRVGDVLKNPAYAGRRMHRGEDVGEGNWEPLIDMATFNTAVRRREAAGANSTRATTVARFLSGVIRCGVCGSKMYSGGKLVSGHAYVCSAPTRCVQRVGVPCDELVTAALLDRLGSPDAYDRLRDTGEQSTELIDATNRVTELEAQLDEAADQFAAGELSAKMLAKVEQRLDPRIAEARKAARQAAVPLDIDIPESGHADWWDTLDHKLRREVVHAMIGVVVVNPTQRGAKVFDPSAISIEWAA